MGRLTAAVTLLLALLTSAAHAQTDSGQIIKRLQQHSLVAGRFTQTRELQGLSRPITSSGKFIFWRHHGLYWETLSPFYQATTFTDDELISWLSPRGPAAKAAPDDRVQRHVSRILLALFAADMSTIDKLFDSRWTVDEAGWSLELTPANAAVGKVIDRAWLRGEQQLRQLRIATRNGDVSTIRFEDVMAPAALEPSRCARFNRQATLRCPDPVAADQ